MWAQTRTNIVPRNWFLRHLRKPKMLGLSTKWRILWAVTISTGLQAKPMLKPLFKLPVHRYHYSRIVCTAAS